MSDIIDRANDLAAAEATAAEAAIRRAAAEIPEGRPGVCDLCGEWAGRLVGGACCACRDRHGLA